MERKNEVEDIVYIEDSEGNSFKSRRWRGVPISDFDGAGERMERLHSEFQPRKDDIFILAYLKCGTHWIHEILHFLITKQTEVRPNVKEKFMIESEDMEQLDKLPTDIPRVLNCHVNPTNLPETVMKQCKVVYVVRNPKDVLVSLFHHTKNMVDYEYNGTIKGFTKLFLDGLIDGGSWFQHTKEFLTIIRDEKPSNILIVEYEKLKQSPASEITRIQHFIDDKQELSKELLEEIVERVSFQSMRKERKNDNIEFFKENMEGFYRKGDVGDWNNYLNAEQSQEIDFQLEKDLREFSSFYRPIYELKK